MLLSGGEDLWELIKEAAGHSRIGNESFHSDEWNLLVRELIAIHQHYQAMVDHL
jgi:hypothetical protein